MIDDHLGEIPVMVQRLCLETSDKFIFQPSKSQVTEDILISLKKFKNSMRWKEFWRLKALKKDETTNEEEKVRMKMMKVPLQMIHFLLMKMVYLQV